VPGPRPPTSNCQRPRLLISDRTQLRHRGFGRSRRYPETMRRSTEAKNLLADLDAELAESGVAAGQTLVWSAAESAVIDAAASAVDRKVRFTRDLDKAETITARLAISVEIRLLEAHIARLLKQVRTDLPQAQRHGLMSTTSRRASKAATSRWRGHEAGS
jgi:hypothetical protein